jgi:hypothetical protein
MSSAKIPKKNFRMAAARRRFFAVALRVEPSAGSVPVMNPSPYYAGYPERIADLKRISRYSFQPVSVRRSPYCNTGTADRKASFVCIRPVGARDSLSGFPHQHAGKQQRLGNRGTQPGQAGNRARATDRIPKELSSGIFSICGPIRYRYSPTPARSDRHQGRVR